MLEEGVSDHSHECVALTALPGAPVAFVVSPPLFDPAKRSLPISCPTRQTWPLQHAGSVATGCTAVWCRAAKAATGGHP